jgi:Flp pilus assembly protein TadD
LHAANTVLLFWALLQLTGALWRSAFVAALFAWHPLHVESIAWVSERKDVLSTFFLLLSILAYTRFATGSKAQAAGTKIAYAAALGFFALGLMSKPMVATLPFVLLLLDYWPLQRTGTPWKALLLEKVPFLAFAALDCAATLWAQKGANSVVSWEALPLSMRLANAIVSCPRYLWKMIWPADLAVLYPYPDRWNAGAIAGSALLVGMITAVAIRQRKQRPYLMMGWLWFLGTLAPVIGLVQVGIQSIADRYTYVPSIGIFVMATWGAAELLQKRPQLTRSVAAVGVAVLILLASVTRVQLNYWRNSVTLFSHATEVTHGSVLSEYNLAEALARNGEEELAAAHYFKALAIQPNRVEAQYNSQTEARYNLGALYVKQGKRVEAESQFRAILATEPDHARAHGALASVLISAGRLPDAAGECREVTRLEPRNSGAWHRLGDVLSRLGDGGGAEKAYAEAARLNATAPKP